MELIEGSGEVKGGQGRLMFLQPAGSGVPIDFYTLVVKLKSLSSKCEGDVFAFLKQTGIAWTIDGPLCAAYAMGMDLDDLVKQVVDLGLQAETEPVDFYVLAQVFPHPGEEGLDPHTRPYYLSLDDGELGFHNTPWKQYVYLK